MIFTDASVNTNLKVGYGACLFVSEPGVSFESLRTRVKVKRFEQTSSTKLELQTLLWALSGVQRSENRIIVYTDSQNIVRLPARRDQLEKNDFRSKKNRRLNNYALYQEFYRITDQWDCEFVKVRGHEKSNKKDEIDRIFTLVDRASRNALRADMG